MALDGKSYRMTR